MFLKQLRLENVRCFEELTLDFEREALNRRRASNNRKWTILLGENGTGKSTVLKAAGLVTCGSSALTDVLSDPKDWIRRGQPSCRISATLETKAGDEREIYLEMKESESISRVISNARKGLEPLDDALENTQRNYFVVGYGSSRRLASDTSIGPERSHYRSPRARSIATLFDSEAQLNPLESWAMELDYESGQEGLDAVQSALSSFLPGMTFDHIDKKAKQLLFKTPDGPIPLSQLSDGYQNVAAWVGDLLYRVHQVFEDYKNPLKTRGLLIIDEVDLHLHPIWQRSLHDFLQRKLPNMQLLVTTHSAVTAQQAQEHQLHYLKREGRSVQLRQFEADPSNLLISQLLLTEAFGLETDESKQIEKQKARYRRLRDKKSLTDREKKEFGRLKSTIGESLTHRVKSVDIKDSQLARLEAVQAKIQKRRRS